jgi:hypothetical protein
VNHDPLPLRPAGNGAQVTSAGGLPPPANAQARARAREEAPAQAAPAAPAAAPAPPPARGARLRARLTQAAVGTGVRGVLTGASAWTSQPPSLAQIWAHHVASARYYNAWAVRYSRYGWGALHLGFAAPAYLLVLATDSAWKVVGLALVLALVLWLM